jgi:precorrin-2 dehydrogenase/sirohydrochlorin ferrochelatase
LQIAISTSGESGALAHRLREELEREFGPEWESWLHWLGEARPVLIGRPVSPGKRRTLLSKLADRKTQEEFFDAGVQLEREAASQMDWPAR